MPEVKPPHRIRAEVYAARHGVGKLWSGIADVEDETFVFTASSTPEDDVIRQLNSYIGLYEEYLAWQRYQELPDGAKHRMMNNPPRETRKPTLPKGIDLKRFRD